MELFFALISVIAIIVGGLIVAIPSIMNYKGWISVSKQQEQYQQSFDKTIEQLSSDKYTAQLSAAVLLRRFFKVKLNYHFLINKKNINENDAFFLRAETINVIASLLRTLPTGVYQKTLADGLSSCNDLSCADLQNANLQNAFLSSDSYRINMSKTDLFCANLTKALVTKIDGQGCYFRNSILCNTRFKDCNFSNASFQGADLTNAYFRFLSVRLNRLKNKLLANYLRNRGNDLATVRNSAFCVAILSNNSFICKYNIFFRKYELSVAIL